MTHAEILDAIRKAEAHLREQGPGGCDHEKMIEALVRAARLLLYAAEAPQ